MDFISYPLISCDPLISSLIKAISFQTFKQIKEKFRIFIREGFCPIGVIDPYGELEPGEIYCSYRMDNYFIGTKGKFKYKKGSLVISSDKVHVLTEEKVLVTKMPCVHPGDVRFMKPV